MLIQCWRQVTGSPGSKFYAAPLETPFPLFASIVTGTEDSGHRLAKWKSWYAQGPLLIASYGLTQFDS